MRYILIILSIALLIWSLKDKPEPAVTPVNEPIAETVAEPQLGGRTTEPSAGEEVMMSL